MPGRAPGAAGRRAARKGGKSGRPPAPGRGRLGRWGALQGGLGVCVIVASAAIGAVLTVAAHGPPGPLLGLFVVAGTVAAALAIRPRDGRMILPVPALSYLVAALTSGILSDRAADSSRTAMAIAAAQWIADGFFAMALATVLAAAITTVRWYLWRHSGRGRRDPDWPVRTWDASAESGYPAGLAGTGRPRESGESGATGGTGGWGGAGSRGTRPRPGPRPGSGPYNFSSGA